MNTSTQRQTEHPARTAPRGPRYTITGDFHYCVIEAESSELGACTIAVATTDSPGAQPGESWRQTFRPFLWLVPETMDPGAFALALYRNWYEQEAQCPNCADEHCVDFSECCEEDDAARPYQLATAEGRAQAWRQLARQWADARWGWDDADDDLQGDRGTQAYEAGERPDGFIDRMAEHWDLEDPTEDWGALAKPEDTARRWQLREAVAAFLLEPWAEAEQDARR